MTSSMSRNSLAHHTEAMAQSHISRPTPNTIHAQTSIQKTSRQMKNITISTWKEYWKTETWKHNQMPITSILQQNSFNELGRKILRIIWIRFSMSSINMMSKTSWPPYRDTLTWSYHESYLIMCRHCDSSIMHQKYNTGNNRTCCASLDHSINPLKQRALMWK